MSRKYLTKEINELLAKAINYGIGNEGINEIKEYIEFNEFGLAFEQILYELHENSIYISYEYYSEIEKVAKLMEIPENNFVHMKDMISANHN